MSVALDVAIGLAFLYLSLALLVTTLQELIASVWRMRAGNLYDAIAGMLEADESETEGTSPEAKKTAAHAKAVLQELFNHPLIRNLASKAPKISDGRPNWLKSGLPSYIPSKTFALALVDVLRRKETATEAVGATHVLANAAAIVGDLPDGSRLKAALGLLLADTETLGKSIDERATIVSERIEGWFNDRMARASGWYKQRAQRISFLIAFLVTLTANADSIHVVDRLWHDAGLRAAVVSNAQRFVDSKSEPSAAGPAPSVAAPAPSVAAPAPSVAGGAAVPPSDPTKDIVASGKQVKEQLAELQASALPVGWLWPEDSTAVVPCIRFDKPLAGAKPDASPPCWKPGVGGWLLLVAGWLLTALAVSLGANFWFDVLSRALQLRGSGPRVSEASGKVER